jgi:hypothetical protein
MALIGLLFIIALWDIGKTAVKHARDDYGKSKAAKVKEAQGTSPGFLTSPQRKTLVRRHATGYWLREILGGFPVTRAGWQAGWTAHKTARAEEKTRVADEHARHAAAQESLAERIRGQRERMEAASKRQGGTQGNAPPLPSETVVQPAPQAQAAPAARRDSDWLKPGEPRCEGCGGTGRYGDATCPACRGWGSAPPDLYSPLAPAGTICQACGNPGAEGDPVLDVAGGRRIHSSHAEDAQASYRQALAAMNATAAADGSGSQPPATEGGHMPTGTASADVTYDQLQAEAAKVVHEAEQQVASLQASRLPNLVEGMAGMVNDSNSLSRAAEIDEAIRAQIKITQQVLDAAQAFKDGLRRDHGAQNEAHQNAPIPLGAQPEFYSG